MAVDPRQDGAILEPGVLVEHFKIVRLVGRGGMGEVYLARDMRLGRKVALKLVHRASLGEEKSIVRFFHEAKLTARFNHPHIVTVYGVGEHEGRPFVALEFLEGQTLRERLEQGRLGLRETLRIGLAIAQALREAHAHNVLHRDLKPGNIVLPLDGRLRVVDFGLAKAIDGSRAMDVVAPAPEDSGALALNQLLSMKTGVSGTPPYMSPEQWDGEECTGATDVWALGVILYELLAGMRPFRALSLHLLGSAICSADPSPTLPEEHDIPAELADLVHACLSKMAAERPRTDEVVEVLRGLVYPGDRSLEGEASPFRGLLPFTERHAGQFFGRDDEIGAFIERLRQEPVLPVLGPSGAGKSSFVQAGVIPRLREQGRWRVLGLRPGRHPFEALRLRLVRGQSAVRADTRTPGSSVGGRSLDSQMQTVDVADVREIIEPVTPSPSAAADEGAWDDTRSSLDGVNFARRLIQSPSKLAVYLQQLAELEDARVLLFVDQLEELYTLVDDDSVRCGFMEAICSAADDPDGSVRVIFTLRDDFLVRLAETEGARRALGHVTLLRSPGSEALREILTRPLERSGYRYDDEGLVDQMVRAVGGEIACLPLLQFACSQLWEQRDRRDKLISSSAYDAIGGVAGALARHADGVLEGLTPEQLQTARSILLRLVTPEGTRAVVARERLLEGAGAAAEEVLDRLIRGRAVVVRKSEEPGGGAVVELVHESLIRSWRRLGRWIDEGREELSFLAEIAQAADLWDKRGRRDEEVWRGDALRDGLRRAERLLVVPDLVRRFLDAGTAFERRRVRRKRALIAAGFALLAAIAIVLALANREARHQRNLADDQRRQAEEKRAEALLEGARAALARQDLIETRAKLRSSLEIQDSPLSRALWWRLSREPLVWRKDLGGYLYRAAFSPRGETVAAAGSSGSIYLFDIHTQGLRVLRGGGDQILTLAFSPDGARIAAGTISGRVSLWETADGSHRGWDSGVDVVRGVAFSPGGETLAVAGERADVRLWEVASGKLLRTLSGHVGKVWAVAFSADGRLLASGGYDKTIRLWDPRTGVQRRVLEGHRERVSAIAFSPDGALLASASADQTVGLWDVATGEERRILNGHTDGVHDVAFTPDGRWLVSGSEDGAVRLWDARTGDARDVLRGHSSAVRGVAADPTGKLVASASLDGSIRVWGSAPAPAAQGHGSHADGVLSLAVAPDDRTIATGGADKTVRLWDLASGESAGVLAGHESGVMGVAFAPDGKALASASSDTSVRLWDVATTHQRAVLRGHSKEIWDVAFAPDGARLASGGIDSTARLWSVETAEGEVLGAYESWVYCTAFSPDGRRLAVGNSDNLIRLVDLESARVTTLTGHTGAPMGLVFGPEGDSLVSGGWDGSVRIWDLRSGGDRVLAQSDAWVWGIDVSPDGKRVGAALSDGTAWVWDAGSGQGIALRGHRSDVNDFRFARGGELAATAGDDGTVRVWDATTGMPLWRAPLILRSPMRAYTHQGWIALEPSAAPPEPPGSAWSRALDERALAASATDDRKTVCLAAHGGGLEVWDAAADRRLAQLDVEHIADVLALPGGCAVLADGRAHLVDREGASTELAAGATAIARDRRRILVAAESAVLAVDAGGEVVETFEVDPGATALVRAEQWLVLGYQEGDVVLYPLTGDEERPTYSFEGVPSSPVVRLLGGPMGTVIIGYADGTLGIWKLDNGAALERARLHGAVVHLALEGDALYAVTELGDHLVWDLSVFHDDYCQLLHQVWRGVPVVWENGLPVRRVRPDDHPCRRTGG